MMDTRQQLIDIATRDVTCLPADATIGEAARIMAQRRFSSIVVTDTENTPLGIVTERNILHAMRAASPPETPLRTSMSAPVVVVPVAMDCLDAYQVCMREGIRHLVLVDGDGAVAGVVSETDFRLHLNLTVLAGRRHLVSVAQRAVPSLPPHSSLMQALNLMQAQRASCVVVVDEEKPVGIVTERDVVRLYSSGPERVAVLLAEVMTAPVLTISGNATINQAAERMLERKVRHLALVDGAGKMVGLVSEHDLTQTMAAGLLDEKHEVDEIFLRTFINTIPDLVWLKDKQGVYLACNRRFEQLYGAKEQDIVGKTDFDFVDSQLAACFRKHDLQAMSDEKHSVNEEWLTFASDGYRGLFETIKTPMQDSQGQLIGVLGVSRDITRRKHTAQQLEDYRRRLEGLVAEESTKFRALVEQSLVGIYIIQDGLFRYVNTGLADMFGYDAAEELIDALPAIQLVKAEDRAMVEENLRRRLAGEVDATRYSFTAYRRDGTEIIVDSHGRRIEYQGRPAIIGTLVDVTELRRSKEELTRLVEEKSASLRQSEELLRTLIEAIPDPIRFKDGAGGWLESNQSARQTFGLAGVDCRGKTDRQLAEIAQPGYKEALLRCHQSDEAAWQAEEVLRLEEVIPAPGGGELNLDVIKKPLFGADGARKGLVIVGRDITELKRAEAELRIIASVFGNSQEAITITDADNAIIDVNPAFTRITGYSREEVLGRNPRILSSGRHDASFYAAMWKTLKENKAWRGEIWNRRKNGEIYAELLSISVISDDAGKVQRHVAVFSDVTYFKEHEAELSRIANYDALTGIPNRRLLADRLGQAIAHAQRNGKMLAVCYIDLDGFKDVNDQYGHETGDRLLVDITRRLQEVLRAGDTLARLGGDEFVVLFNDLSLESECFQVLERIVQTIARPMLLGEHQVAVSASIGVTFYPADDEGGDSLLRHADQAMYVAKQSGKNRFHLYDTIHDQRVHSLHESRRRISQGLEAGEFELYYQPRLELASGRISGVEALVRWHHPEHGLLHPAAFLPSIEHAEQEIRLGNWVIDTALAQLRIWEQAGIALEVSVNVSMRHLQSPGFVAELQRKLALQPALAHGRLQIEIPEALALADTTQSAALIDACRDLGVSFALDDFGAGYSSLMHLRKLGAGTLKISQSFVQDMASNAGNRAIVQGAIALANTFGRKTVAKGVEDPGLLQMLAGMGCGYVQGYGLAHPMTAVEFLDWYRKR
ncbi:cyclic di-GMP phosphodiesterase Gmr [mine drainage metagenome]|uniref:Cyclic di-GMP phosphodiesterase Gmr n=1 Tax=mine drainage metagenome TaxID=410659 RepID=A0A1J5U593_9ZZZZ